jgi:hypothetical protein
MATAPLEPRVDRANHHPGSTRSGLPHQRLTVVLPLHWAPNEPRRGSRGGGPYSVRLLQARHVSFRQLRTCTSANVGQQCANRRPEQMQQSRGTKSRLLDHLVGAQQEEWSHSISSSASDRNDGGIVRPSAFAVVRLMTNSNLIGS